MIKSCPSSWFCQRLFVSLLQFSDLRSDLSIYPSLYSARQADPHGANHRPSHFLRSFGPVKLFGIAIHADVHDLNFQKCNNHLVSFIKVEGLFVSYIVDIFDTIKSKMTV